MLAGHGTGGFALNGEHQHDVGLLRLRGEGPPIQVRQLVAQVVERLVVRGVVPQEHGLGASDALRQRRRIYGPHISAFLSFLSAESRAAKPLLDFSQALFKNFHPAR